MLTNRGETGWLNQLDSKYLVFDKSRFHTVGWFHWERCHNFCCDLKKTIVVAGKIEPSKASYENWCHSGRSYCNYEVIINNLTYTQRWKHSIANKQLNKSDKNKEHCEFGNSKTFKVLFWGWQWHVSGTKRYSTISRIWIQGPLPESVDHLSSTKTYICMIQGVLKTWWFLLQGIAPGMSWNFVLWKRQNYFEICRRRTLWVLLNKKTEGFVHLWKMQCIFA